MNSETTSFLRNLVIILLAIFLVLYLWNHWPGIAADTSRLIHSVPSVDHRRTVMSDQYGPYQVVRTDGYQHVLQDEQGLLYSMYTPSQYGRYVPMRGRWYYLKPVSGGWILEP